MWMAVEIFKRGGFAMFPLALIVLVLLAILVRTSWQLTRNGRSNATAIQSGLDGLLFWGGFAVVIGVLGSAIGYHKAMASIVARGLVNPQALWMGSAEGLVSSIAGMLALGAAGALWFLLRWRFLKDR